MNTAIKSPAKANNLNRMSVYLAAYNYEGSILYWIHNYYILHI